MRPTDLHFKSPDDLSSEFSFPMISYTGRSLSFGKLMNKSVRSSFPREKKFDFLNKNNISQASPASYNTHESFKKLHKPSCMAKYVFFQE